MKKMESLLGTAMQLSATNIRERIESKQPLWIVIFGDGNCVAGWYDEREDSEYMDLSHVIGRHRIDIDDYEASYAWMLPHMNMFDASE